jgi:hypothetical protein
MGLYSAPATPPPPDYAAAQKAGVEADANTLPFRLAVSQAANLGKVWTDPETGRTYDFTGLGADANNQAALDQAMQMMQGGQDIADASARRQLQSQLELLPQFNQLNLEQQKAALDMALAASNDATKNTYEQNLAYQPKFGDLQRTENAKTFDQNLELGQKGTRAMAALQNELLPQTNAVQRTEDAKTFDSNLAMGEKGTRQNVGLMTELQPILNAMQRGEYAKDYTQNMDLGEQSTRRAASLQNELLPAANKAGLDAQTAATMAGVEALKTSDPARYALQQKLLAAANTDLDAGSNLTAEQLDSMQQKVRGAQAARGNILGAGAGYDEARMAAEMGQNLQQQRRQSALAVLTGSDVAPRYTVTGAPAYNQPGVQGHGDLNPLMPNYQTAAPVNPLMPNYNSTQAINPQVPNFNATTAAAPNMSASPVSPINPLAYLNPNAGSQGSDYANSVWQTQFKAKSEEVNPWMAGLGMAGKAAGVAGQLMAL